MTLTGDSNVPGTGRSVTPMRRINAVHRTSAIVLGLGIGVFGVLGLINRLDFFSTTGAPLLGLSSNGLLSTISLVTAAVLIAAGLRGGRIASTITVTVGTLFLLSGVGNVLVLNSSWNVLAFRMPNVIFSLVVGLILLCLGAWGRFTGRLPDDNPYRRERHPREGGRDTALEEQPVDGQSDHSSQPAPGAYRPTDAVDIRALADAERAVAQGAGTTEQQAGIEAADGARATEDRLSAWRRTHDRSDDVDRK